MDLDKEEMTDLNNMINEPKSVFNFCILRKSYPRLIVFENTIKLF